MLLRIPKERSLGAAAQQVAVDPHLGVAVDAVEVHPHAPALLRQHQPTHVILELGGNDALRGLPLADVLMVAISQMVSMVPEGLPVAMTIALAVGMQRMAARKAIVRRLAAVEIGRASCRERVSSPV